jgi:sucrose phosphorylase
MTLETKLKDHLAFIYGDEVSEAVYEQLEARLEAFRQQHPELNRSIDPSERVTEADSILITYGDQVREPGKPTLLSLAEFLHTHVAGEISSVHILPFYPYSSDDGFSVIDYQAVDPELGDWQDLSLLRRDFRLMFDAVINHISAQSEWFKGFLVDAPQYEDYFITVDPSVDLSTVVRPRTSPLLTPVETPSGTQHVWTTFTADQIDLNFKNPQVLLEIIDVLLFYVSQGAEFIRLDAIAYLWKEIGTSSIHLPETHRVVQLFRTILDAVAPQVMIITETNVPHQENISYFGDGQNEAQLVYQFSLAPLILHTFYTADATVLQEWTAGLEALPETNTFFNFIASHDGIGVRPAEGILTADQIQTLVDKTLAHGGQVGYKTNPDGSRSPYELNITLFDALSDPEAEEAEALQIDRFVASQAIMLAMVGVPGIYVHSLVGSSNNYAGMEETGRARTLNREKWARAEIEARLKDPNSRASTIFARYIQMLEIRADHPAFHPNGRQQVVGDNPALFCLLRTSPNGEEQVLCLHNISTQPQTVTFADGVLPNPDSWQDLFTEETVPVMKGQLTVALEPYGVKWLVE